MLGYMRGGLEVYESMCESGVKECARRYDVRVYVTLCRQSVCGIREDVMLECM